MVMVLDSMLLGGFLVLFWTPIFMVLFRLAIAPEIACFIGFFGNWPPFLRILENRPPNCVSFNPRLTKMRSRTHRSECDFARTFDRLFGGRLVAFSSSILTPRLKDDLPVYRCFLCLGQRLGPLFRPVLDPTLARVFRHFQTRTCSLPHKKSSDVTLPIGNKSAHPALLRLVEK